jgi:4-hydroxybutyryl-CoA dehydratase/vinylacetyl-CoA-Delta-isomerase
MQIGYKKNLAKHLAGITNDIEEPSEHSEYFDRVFKTKDSLL